MGLGQEDTSHGPACYSSETLNCNSEAGSEGCTQAQGSLVTAHQSPRSRRLPRAYLECADGDTLDAGEHQIDYVSAQVS